MSEFGDGSSFAGAVDAYQEEEAGGVAGPIDLCFAFGEEGDDESFEEFERAVGIGDAQLLGADSQRVNQHDGGADAYVGGYQGLFQFLEEFLGDGAVVAEEVGDPSENGF